MKRNILVLAMLTIAFVGGLKAQFVTYVPFQNGEKGIGLNVGIGGWFGPSDFIIDNSSSSIYNGYQGTKLKRLPFNPSVALHYRRVLSGNRVDWGNSLIIGMSWWSGKVEGEQTANPANTFETNFKYHRFELSDQYYIMIPVGDKLSIKAGIGATLSCNFDPTSTTEFSDGTPSVKSEGGLDFMDRLGCSIDGIVGVEYTLNESFVASCNLTCYAFDFFGLFDDSATKGYRGVGEGLFVNKKLPYQLTFGIAYVL
ncbi:MAG: hypothetical protein J6X86_06040 [Bacteroidales bacterium]|nr:hypothetical protein [Bacteroidales bacterium]